MRQIVLDTETTGLEWRKGNRVVEIGCVELVERRPTGRTFWKYINPERDFEAGAAEVTGLNLEMLADKPLFKDIADEFIEFIRGAELVIHNAAFDIGFLDYELSLLGPHYGRIADICTVEDSLLLARQRFPGQREIFGEASEAAAQATASAAMHYDFGPASGERPRVAVSAEELAAHEARLEKLRKKAGGTAMWDVVSQPAMAEVA